MGFNEEINEVNHIDEIVDEIVKESEEYTPQFSDVAPIAEESEEPVVVKKKKSPLQVPIIIAIVILIVAVLGYFAVDMFIPTIEGTWIYAADDGSKIYYTFEDSAEKNNLILNRGTIYQISEYETSTGEDGSQVITLITNSGYSNVDYTYTVDGNKLLRNRVLTLSSPDGTSVTLNQAKKPKDSDYITPDDNFKEVEGLTGEWVYEYEGMDATMTLTFNDDGTMILNEYGFQEYHCVYNVDKSTINFSFFDTEVIAQEMEYELKDGNLIFNNIMWTRAENATPNEG